MEFKLTKTFLSKKPSYKSFVIGAISLGFLFLFFGADPAKFSATHRQIFEHGEYWRAFTAALLHADLVHLAHNAFFFAGLAALLSNYFGFWVFPVLSIVAGGLINLATLATYPPDVSLVGISGVVYFMASFWLTLYVLIERRQTLFVRFVHAIAVSLIFLFPEAFQPNTSYMAHGIGFLFGIPAALMYYALNSKKIRAADVWVPIEKKYEEMENIILLEQSSYRQLPPEEDVPAQRVSDCAQCPQH